MNVSEEAQSIVQGSRHNDYGAATTNMRNIAEMWTVILGIHVTSRDVARCMMAMKLARDTFKAKRDNLVDIVGYALIAEMIEEEQNP